MSIKSSLEKVAQFITPVHATSSLDVAANREHLRSGDVERMRDGLGFLIALGPAGRDARPEIEALLGHEDPEIAGLAAKALAAIDR